MKALNEIGIKKMTKFIFYSYVDFLYSLLILPPFRKIFLILIGSKIGKDSVLMKVKFFNWYHKGPKGLIIGKNCFIGDETLIDLHDSIIIEDNVTIAQRVTIITHLNVGYDNHPLQKYFPKSSKPVTIKNGSVIGASATILPGVIIGPQSFVAAGSVVNKNVSPKTLVAGVPAKPVRKIK